MNETITIDKRKKKHAITGADKIKKIPSLKKTLDFKIKKRLNTNLLSLI